MVQFHPTGMEWPRRAAGTLATESTRWEGAMYILRRGSLIGVVLPHVMIIYAGFEKKRIIQHS